MPSQRPSPRESFESLQAELQTLDSKINLIAQKIKTMEKNEEIIGRTLITLNERVEKFSKEAGGAARGEKTDEGKYASRQEVQELKALLDAINPLEFATIDQVKELLDDALKKSGRR